LDRKPAVIEDDFKEGYILAPYFSEALPVFEKQESSMYLFYTNMMQAIDLGKEDRRLTGVEFNRESAERPLVRSAAPAEGPSGVTKTLADAETAYTARDLAAAKQLFLNSLSQTDQRSVQATAYYGLGRIALLEKNLDAAERLFEKSLELGPEPFDKAWDLVYLGRLALAAADQDKAAGYFQSALQLEGATAKARQEASQGLELIRQMKDNGKEL
jgi:tetratricopeptide (TPR) repeat protein